MKKNNHAAEGPGGLVYTARLPLSSATLNWLADLIRGRMKRIGSRWRALPAGRIAGIVLAVLRCDQRPHVVEPAVIAGPAVPLDGGPLFDGGDWQRPVGQSTSMRKSPRAIRHHIR
ncbi:hypothetical protein [Streptomyces sp. NPDC056227]|uniref:hypothetical protein n=1 Tax=Streptomyces sp. NPDC056227 TaxID=3345753 RepID=UPI0035D96069